MARKNKEAPLKSDALIKKRILALLTVFSLLVIALIARAGYWQIYKSDWLKEMAQDQWSREINIFAERGQILDKNGYPLAISVRCYTVVLHPSIIDTQSKKYDSEDYINSFSNDLAQILEITPEDVKKVIAKEQSQVILKRNVTDTQADAIRSLVYQYSVNENGEIKDKTKAYSGITIVEDIRREYPMGSFLTQVLGFTSVDGIGLEGIESRFDKYLKGVNGKLVVETDREGVKISGAYEERTEPIDGNMLQLTIDITLQSFAESALDMCVLEQDPQSATIIVMDPKTGAILAMATKPDYDNNEPPRDNLTLLRELTENKAVTYAYEPGSLFSVITAAAAINSGDADRNEDYNCEGFKTINNQKINCLSSEPHGHQDLSEVIQNTCGSAFMDMAMSMGQETFYNYIYDFGFGVRSGIKLYSESSGAVTAEKYVKDVDLARISYGQAITATPLQIVTAFSAIANGGDLMQPYIADKIISPEGEVLEQYQSKVRKEVISDYTSSVMLQILYDSVENGNGLKCRIQGYEIGGISGVAQKYDDQGQVLHDEYIASFAAVAPINNPQLVVLLMVESPKGSNYGSKAAAPYVRNFFEEALSYLNVLPNSQYVSTQDKYEVPDLMNMTLTEAKSELAQKGFGCISEGFDGKIVSQIPGAGAMLENGSNVIVQLAAVSDDGISYLVEVPDLFGLTPTEALDLLNENNLTMRIVSSGNVVMEQSPASGTEVFRGTQVALGFEYFDSEEDGEEN
ncbi:MAG: penicillin-binding transpeptidase domain-containing protein [Eubacteriales bacterium]